MTPPGRDTKPSQISFQQTLVIIYLPRKDRKLGYLRQKRRSHKHSNLQARRNQTWSGGEWGWSIEGRIRDLLGSSEDIFWRENLKWNTEFAETGSRDYWEYHKDTVSVFLNLYLDLTKKILYVRNPIYFLYFCSKLLLWYHTNPRSLAFYLYCTNGDLETV